MTKTETTPEKLLHQARTLFWTRGYSNVPVRAIASAAGVDVALISRHFGSKRGLFEATVRQGYDELTLPGTAAELQDFIVALYASVPRVGGAPSLISMIIANAHDEEVGPLVRDLHASHLQAPLERLIGDPGRAALFVAVLIGFAVTEKNLLLDGISEPGTAEFETQLRRLMRAALEDGA